MKTTKWMAVIAVAFAAQSVASAQWPAFRGPQGDGVAQDDAPLTWSSERNLVWKVAMPQPSNGSPIVAGGRVFVTCAEDDEGQQLSTYCFDSETGEQVWAKTVATGEKLPRHKTNPHGSTTPASDGEHVVVWHASAGLHCYGKDGEELWSRDLGEFAHMWGYGSSPIIHDGKVFLNSGPGASPFVAALDLASGDTVWLNEETEEGTIDRRADGAPHGSWSTPVVVEVGESYHVIVVLPTRVAAYDADSGELVWSCDGVGHGRGDLAYSSPVIAGDLCFVTGGYKGPSMAIRLGGRGDVTRTHRLYRQGNSPQSIGSGVFVDGFIYLPNADAGKGLQCLDPATGDRRWSVRSPAPFWGSLVLAGGHLYGVCQDGTTIVFEPSPDGYEELAENELDETCNATPAVSAGRIYIRTHNNLYCFGL